MPARPRAFSERMRSSGRRGEGDGSSSERCAGPRPPAHPRGIDAEPGPLYGSGLEPERATHAARPLRAAEQRAHAQELLGRPQVGVVERGVVLHDVRSGLVTVTGAGHPLLVAAPLPARRLHDREDARRAGIALRRPAPRGHGFPSRGGVDLGRVADPAVVQRNPARGGQRVDEGGVDRADDIVEAPVLHPDPDDVVVRDRWAGTRPARRERLGRAGGRCRLGPGPCPSLGGRLPVVPAGGTEQAQRQEGPDAPDRRPEARSVDGIVESTSAAGGPTRRTVGVIEVEHQSSPPETLRRDPGDIARRTLRRAFLAVASRARPKPGVRVLTYHLMPPPREFRRHVEIIRTRAEIIDETTLLELVTSGRRSNGTSHVLITFDDGYQNNVDDSSLELTRELGVRPLVFVVGAAVRPDFGTPRRLMRSPAGAPHPLASTESLRNAVSAGWAIGSHTA